MPYPRLMHENYLDHPASPLTAQELASVTYGPNRANSWGDPALSIVVSSCADNPSYLNRLVNDITEQEYRGPRQMLLMSARNPDSVTHEVAKRASDRGLHTTIHTVEPGKGFRADMLNTGLERSDTRYVMFMTGHVALSHTGLFSTAAGAMREGAAAAYGIALPDIGASLTERLGARQLGVREQLLAGNVAMNGDALGLLSTDCAIVDREQLPRWKKAFDTSFGHGGADGALGRDLIEDGKKVLRMPGMSFYHTHGFGPIRSARQLLAWRQMARPRPFSERQMAWHPHLGL